MKKVILFTLFALTIAVNTIAQNTCTTATTAAIGANQAPAQQEFWYKFSPAGQPMAQYNIHYDSKTFNVRAEVFAGSCDNLLGQGSNIPAIAGDTRTYYIRFTWNSGAPQAFEWELNQYLIVPMTGISVTPKTHSLALGGSFILDDVFSVSAVPANTTDSYLTEYELLDGEGIISPTVFQASNTTLTATGSGTVKLVFYATSWNDYSSLGKDTVTINVAAPAPCSSATTISAGANTAQAVQEQWFRFTAAKTGIYTFDHEAVDMDSDGKNDLVANWTVYEGDCNSLHSIEEVAFAGRQFRAEA